MQDGSLGGSGHLKKALHHPETHGNVNQHGQSLAEGEVADCPKWPPESNQGPIRPPCPLQAAMPQAWKREFQSEDDDMPWPRKSASNFHDMSPAKVPPAVSTQREHARR